MNAPIEVQHQLSVTTLGMGGYDIDGKTTRLDLCFPRDAVDHEIGKQLEHLPVADLPRMAKKIDITKRLPTNNDESASCASISSSTSSNISTVASSNDTNAKSIVRFATDKRGRLLCVHHRNRDIRTKKETLDCWYTPHDFRQFRNDCKQEAIKQQKTSYRDNFAAVYAACTKGNFKGVTKERAYISAASCRGLEVVVFPTLHSDRKNTIATVLKTQAALPRSVPEATRADAIASASRYLSKQARQLARVLGSGDAAVVVANNRIAALQDQQKLKSSSLVVPHCFITC
jgi:hypothetical protein